MKKHCYKRADGRWEYNKQENGYKYYTIANTYRELLDKIQKIQPKLIKQVKNVKTKSITFGSYFDFYIENYIKHKNYTKETIDEWERIYRLHIAHTFNKIPLEKLTTETLQTFIDNVDKERLQEKIYQRIIRVLKKALITGKIKKDITLGLEKPKRKNIQVRTPLTLEEQKTLLSAVENTSFYVFTIFSLVIGSRRDETLKFNLQEDLDEEKQTIHIKGTKTSNSDRYVNVSKGFINFLKENMKDNCFKITRYYATQFFGSLMKKLNINKCLHCLRHTCSANLYFLGAKDKYRQMQLGHASIVTTNDIYTNITENIPKASLLEIYGDLYPQF